MTQDQLAAVAAQAATMMHLATTSVKVRSGYHRYLFIRPLPASNFRRHADGDGRAFACKKKMKKWGKKKKKSFCSPPLPPPPPLYSLLDTMVASACRYSSTNVVQSVSSATEEMPSSQRDRPCRSSDRSPPSVPLQYGQKAVARHARTMTGSAICRRPSSRIGYDVVCAAINHHRRQPVARSTHT